MNKEIKEDFLRRWKRYFDGAELPIAFYYTDEREGAKLVSARRADRCLIANLDTIRTGTPLLFGADSIGCGGGQRYTGFSDAIMPDFEYFLSCGIPGKLEGERYKKTPELVKKIMARMPKFHAPKKFLLFKRWDQLEAGEQPEVVIFFAAPDVLAGLFTLASFDEAEENGVVAPFGAGCASVVQYPYQERDSRRPRCVLGLFDPSARPHVPSGTLSFAAPINKFARMVENMEESFLITSTWRKIRTRIGKT